MARLEPEGMRSKELADMLFVSVRTVDSHLQRIYAKLGVGTRQELAGALSQLETLAGATTGEVRPGTGISPGSGRRRRI